MRSFLMFLLGYIAGVVSICILALFLAMIKSNVEPVNSVEKDDKHITLFEEPAECVTTSALRVYRVLDEYYAIADEVEYKSYLGEYSYKSGAIKVVVKSKEKNIFYDDQIIEIPFGKCMRQIGVYTEYSNTYPVVKMAELSVQNSTPAKSALTTNGTSSSYTKRSVEVKSTATETTTKSNSSKPKDDNIKLFAAPTDCVSTSVFKVYRVIDEYYAIAEEVEYYSSLDTYYTKYGGIKVVIKSEEKNKYFDDQIIKMPAGKCMRQIGVYSKYSDTYPVVKITE